MKTVRRIVLSGVALMGIGFAGAVAAPVASAFTVTPAPGGGTVTLNQGEAAAVGNANVAGAVDAVLPGYSDGHGESLGKAIDSRADLAGRVPGANLDITLVDFPHDPGFYVIPWK